MLNSTVANETLPQSGSLLGNGKTIVKESLFLSTSSAIPGDFGIKHLATANKTKLIVWDIYCINLKYKIEKEFLNTVNLFFCNHQSFDQIDTALQALLFWASDCLNMPTTFYTPKDLINIIHICTILHTIILNYCMYYYILYVLLHVYYYILYNNIVLQY